MYSKEDVDVRMCRFTRKISIKFAIAEQLTLAEPRLLARGIEGVASRGIKVKPDRPERRRRL